MKNWFELFAFCDFMLKFILRKMNKKNDSLLAFMFITIVRRAEQLNERNGKEELKRTNNNNITFVKNVAKQMIQCANTCNMSSSDDDASSSIMQSNEQNK